MQELEVFRHAEFGELRTLEIDNQPWFVGQDIADALGYVKARNAIAAHVEKDDALKQGITDSLGRTQQMTIINESGLYSLILSSKLDSAKRFKHWVTSEVLPSIRKNGAYLTNQKAASLFTQDGLADLLLQAGEQLKAKELVIQQMQPKALFADAVSASSSTILVGDLAKLLRQNGYQTGQKRLFKQLREEGYLIKRRGSDYNSPTQYSMEHGLFEVKESTHINSDGVTIITKTPKVTGKGQIYFINRYCGKN